MHLHSTIFFCLEKYYYVHGVRKWGFFFGYCGHFTWLKSNYFTSFQDNIPHDIPFQPGEQPSWIYLKITFSSSQWHFRILTFVCTNWLSGFSLFLHISFRKAFFNVCKIFVYKVNRRLVSEVRIVTTEIKY